MSVYIPGMEMPKGCAFCKISRRNGKKMICPFIWKCEGDIHDPMSADHRLDDCPLIPVPEHGRLIDADEACRRFPVDADPRNGYMLYKLNNELPTILPADKEGEG